MAEQARQQHWQLALRVVGEGVQAGANVFLRTAGVRACADGGAWREALA